MQLSMELWYEFTIGCLHSSLGAAWIFHYCHYCHYFMFLHYLSDFYGKVFDKVVFCWNFARKFILLEVMSWCGAMMAIIFAKIMNTVVKKSLISFWKFMWWYLNWYLNSTDLISTLYLFYLVTSLQLVKKILIMQHNGAQRNVTFCDEAKQWT